MAELKVGAATVKVTFPERMFPLPPSENFIGVHDDPNIHVVVFEAQERFAFAAYDLCDMCDKKAISKLLQEEPGVAADHVIIHSVHTLSSPHCRHNEEADTPGLKEKNDLMLECILEATKAAAEKALSSMRPAKAGFRMGYTGINVSRNIETNRGFWQGGGDDGFADHSMPVLRIDDMEGRPIVIFYAPNCAASVLELCFLSTGGRLVSGDIATWSGDVLEQAYGDGCVAVYICGASGDQWQYLRAQHTMVGRNGEYTVKDIHEAGYVLNEMLGDRLAQQVFKTADAIGTAEVEPELRYVQKKFLYPGQKPSLPLKKGPALSCEYAPAEDTEAAVGLLKLTKDTVVVCIGLEVTANFLGKLRANSPFRNTILMEFAAAGKGYLAEEAYYDRFAPQTRNCNYARGTAERFLEDILRELREL